MRTLLFWLLLLAPSSARADDTALSIALSSRNIITAAVNTYNATGMYGDDVHDDAPAINSSIAFWKAAFVNLHGGFNVSPATFVLPKAASAYKINSGLNFTGINAGQVVVRFEGVIDCQMTGGVCVDFLGSRQMSVDTLNLYQTYSATQPAIGVQIGRNTAAVASQMDFTDLFILGQFSQAAAINYASETTQWTHPTISNYTATAGAYALVADGTNCLFPATSAFISVTAATCTGYSFNEFTVTTGSFGSAAPNNVMWIGGAGKFTCIRCWGSTNINSAATGTAYGMVLYSPSNAAIFMMDADIHFEPAGHLTADFLIDGPSGSHAKIYGLTHRDNQVQASSSVFAHTSNIIDVQITDADYHEGASVTTNLPVFDIPTDYTSNGTYHGLSAGGTAWNLPTTRYIGCLDIPQNYTCNLTSLTIGGVTVVAP